MSHWDIGITAGSLPPSVPTTFTADNATTATPASNNLNVFTGSTSDNDVDGIRSIASGSTVTYQLTNRFRQTTTTSGAVTSTVTLLSALPAGVYVLDIKIAGDSTAGAPAAGVGYTIVGAVRSDGVTATLIPGQQTDSFEEASMVGANASIGILGNTITATVTGVAAYDISWAVVGDYTFVT